MNPVSPDAPIVSNADYEKFLKCLIDKIEDIRLNIHSPTSLPDVACPQLDTKNQYLELTDTITHMTPSSSPLDIIPTKFLLQILDNVAPCLLSIVNSSLSSCVVPDYFKTASIHLFLKNPVLILLSRATTDQFRKYPFKQKS